MKRRFLHQWEDLLGAVLELQALRATGDPKAVADGRLTEAEAADRARRAAALVALWRHVVERTPFDIDNPCRSLGASWAELSTDLAAALTRAKARAAAADERVVELDDDSDIARLFGEVRARKATVVVPGGGGRARTGAETMHRRPQWRENRPVLPLARTHEASGVDEPARTAARRFADALVLAAIALSFLTIVIRVCLALAEKLL